MRLTLLIVGAAPPTTMSANTVTIPARAQVALAVVRCLPDRERERVAPHNRRKREDLRLSLLPTRVASPVVCALVSARMMTQSAQRSTSPGTSTPEGSCPDVPCVRSTLCHGAGGSMSHLSPLFLLETRLLPWSCSLPCRRKCTLAMGVAYVSALVVGAGCVCLASWRAACCSFGRAGRRQGVGALSAAAR